MATQETQIKFRDFSNFHMQDSPAITGDASTAASNFIFPIKYGNLLLNVCAESFRDSSGTPRKRIIPRPIMTSATAGIPVVVSGYRSSPNQVRAATYWDVTNSVYSYVLTSTPDGSIFYDGSSTALTTGLARLNGSVDVSVGTTRYYDGVNQYLVFSNGTARPYYINSSNTVTQIADVDCPSGTGVSPYIAYMDGALFVAKNNAIHNSEFGSITNWPGYSRTVEQFPATIVALVRHKNCIVAFTKTSAEFFFNAGYSGTSPLSRQETYATKIGMYGGDSLGQAPFVDLRDDTFFISTSTNAGPSISRLSNFKITKISTGNIDRILKNAQFLNITGFEYFGHTFVVVQCRGTAATTTSAQSITLVYDVQEEIWAVWTQRQSSSVGTPAYSFNRTVQAEYMQEFAYDYFVTSLTGDYTGFHSFTGERHPVARPDITGSAAITNISYNCDYSSTDFPVDFCIRLTDESFGNQKQKHLKRMFFVNWQNSSTGTRPDVSTYVFNNAYKDAGSSYPTAITAPTYGDSVITNLSTGRKFTIECVWSGGLWTGLDGLEFHYNEGEQ